MLPQQKRSLKQRTLEEKEEDKGQSELGYVKGFGVSRTEKTSNLIDFYVASESLNEVNITTMT